MKRIVVLIVILLVTGMYVNACAEPATVPVPYSSPGPTTTPGTTSKAAPASAPVTGIQAGNQAPDFNYELDGRAGALSGLRGKPVMLNFWATWCGPCRLEMPFLEEVFKEQSGSILTTLAVNVGEDKNTVNAFVHYNKMALPVVLDSKNEIARKYRVNAIPTTFFIDKSGIIRSVKIGAFPSKADVEKNLKLIMP